MSPTIWPSATSNETLSSATMPPKRTVRSRTDRMGWSDTDICSRLYGERRALSTPLQRFAHRAGTLFATTNRRHDELPPLADHLLWLRSALHRGGVDEAGAPVELPGRHQERSGRARDLRTAVSSGLDLAQREADQAGPCLSSKSARPAATRQADPLLRPGRPRPVRSASPDAFSVCLADSSLAPLTAVHVLAGRHSRHGAEPGPVQPAVRVLRAAAASRARLALHADLRGRLLPE